jgi:hypothetical protein
MKTLTEPRRESEDLVPAAPKKEQQLKFPIDPASMGALNAGLSNTLLDKLKVRSIYFDTTAATPPNVEGQMLYNKTTPTFQVYLNGAVVDFPTSGGGKTATFVIGPSSNSDSDAYDYVTDGTDDDVQIQAAIDALPTNGGSICFREGTYTLGSATVTIAKNGVELFGMGAGTIITCKTSFDKHFFTLGHASTTYSNCVIRDFKFDGYETNQSIAKDIINNQSLSVDLVNLRVDSSVFVNSSNSAINNTPNSTVISKCYFSDWRTAKFVIQGDGIITDCFFTNTITTAKYINGSTTIKGCIFVMPASYNTTAIQANTLFIGNYVFVGESAGASCQILQGARCVVSNNFTLGNSFNGNCLGSTGNTVNGNLFDIGTSAGSSCILVDTVTICSNNYILFGSSANANATAIKDATIALGNSVIGAGIAISGGGDISHNITI